MTWTIGWSWTEGRMEITTNPDKTKEALWVHGGPFYFNPSVGGRVYVYFGFRPTATWSSGYGDEGWLTPLARWMKRWGWGNFGIAVRRAK